MSTLTDRRFLPRIEDEQVARAVARLQNHDDLKALLGWLEEAKTHAVQQITGKLDHEVLIKWATTLQVIDDILATNREAHDNWVRVRAEKTQQHTKWEE